MVVDKSDVPKIYLLEDFFPIVRGELAQPESCFVIERESSLPSIVDHRCRHIKRSPVLDSEIFWFDFASGRHQDLIIRQNGTRLGSCDPNNVLCDFDWPILPTPTPSPTNTITPAVSPTATETPTSTATFTLTSSPTTTETPTIPSTFTSTPSPTVTPPPIDLTLVTNHDYIQFVGDAIYEQKFPGRNKPRPVDNSKPYLGVPWDEAVAYCEWRGKQLPSSSNYEKAVGLRDFVVYRSVGEWTIDGDGSSRLVIRYDSNTSFATEDVSTALDMVWVRSTVGFRCMRVP